MGQLIGGSWTEEEHFPTDAGGAFRRPSAGFRFRDALSPEPGRYHLYLAHACPWCHRTAITRALKGLESVVTVSFVHPLMREGGWRFTGPDYEDPLFGARHVHELYTRADPAYTGRATVPVLWDRAEDRLLCNESEDIVRLFDARGSGPELYPDRWRAEIDAVNSVVYAAINDGVYRCGFARSQEAYDQAFDALFTTLDEISARLAHRPWLVGEAITEADIRLWVTLVRFDAVYVGHFKCNRNRIGDDPVLQRYLERLYAEPAFRETTRMEEIKLHYYGSHRSINPSGIVPNGPYLPWLARG